MPNIVLVHFREFCGITPLHGFGFVNHAERRAVEAVLWLFVVVVCFGLTIRDTISLVTLYMSQPTATSIVLQANTTMQYGTPGVCLEIDRFAFTQSNPALNGSTAPYDLNTFNATLYTFPWDLVTAATTSNSMAAICPGANFTSCLANQTVMDIAYLMYASFTDYDQNFFGPFVNGAYNPNTVILIDTLLLYLQQHQINLYTFAKVTSGYFCYRMQFMAMYYQFDTTQGQYINKPIDPCGDLTVQNWIGSRSLDYGNDLFCFQIIVPTSASTGPTIMFVGATDYLTIQADLEQNIYGPTPGSGYPSWAMSKLNMNFDLRNGDGVIDTTSADGNFVALSKCQGQVGIGIANMFIAYNKTMSPCSTISQYPCTKSCNAQWILKNRQCNSLLYYGSMYAPDQTKPLCTTHVTMADAASYLNTARSTGQNPMTKLSPAPNNYAACNDISNCWQPCNNTIYEYTVIWDNQCDTPPTKMTLYPAKFLYPIFSETLTLDLLGFFYSFGGSIGLWLGGSFIAFVHIPIFIITTIRDKIRARRQKTNPMYATSGGDQAGVIPPKPVKPDEPNVSTLNPTVKS